jgi:hypothetical protein
MAEKYQSNWDIAINTPAPKGPDEREQFIVNEAWKRFKICVDFEAPARVNFEYDYKFANADSHNKFQWDSTLVTSRNEEQRPCLTINKTQQHNLMVINDAKQNKPGIRIRPVGDQASYDAAQVYQELVYHIEYVSNAENIYDSALTFQVEAGMGYWRVVTEEIADDTFDQEIYIRRIKDPRSVYLDNNINEVDGSDASFGFIFDDMAKDLFAAKYPEFASVASQTVLGDSTYGWISENNIRVCEYYRKIQRKSKLVTWTSPNGGQVLKKIDDLDEFEKEVYKEVSKRENREQYQYKERKIVIDDVEWFKIAGNRIIDEGPWLGKYIPIVRLPGIETIIDGVLDRKGHTRALIDPQRMYNWNASADVEYGALQTKAPWIAPSAAIEGFEQYYETANKINYSYLPYNHIDEDGNPIPAPTRPLPPQPSPAYVQRMEISINEMMMASGQFQAQMGENENAKSGVAINARQRQGDRATYHFLDNQAIAIRFTGKIIIDLVPKIYDTKRVQRITARDGTIMNVTIDPKAPQALQKMQSEEKDNEEKIKEIIFNPNIGKYDIQSDTGPSYATRRMEAFNALTQIAAQNKDFMQIGGDLYFKVADFPEADTLAMRYRRSIPPAILGEGPDPNTEAAMHAAADKIEQLTQLASQQAKELADKDREMELKEHEFKLGVLQAGVKENRDDYDAETRRLTAVGNAGPIVTPKMLEPVLKQLLQGMLAEGSLVDEKVIENAPMGSNQEEAAEGEETPPMEGARKAPDGKWYTENPDGGYLRVEQ